MAGAVNKVMGQIEIDPRRNGGASLRRPKGERKYAILRLKKISGEKGRGKANLSAAARHNLRERDAANARPEDAHRNIHLAGARTAKELMALWDERAPEKVRRNAVPAIEYVMSASPEEMAQMGSIQSEDYLRDAFAWIEEKHGAENILSAVIHMDETTPHLQVLVIPLDERGKLNARDIVGNAKDLSAMQTDYAERVGAKYGLERGLMRSGAKHETIKSFYARANANENLSLNLPERATGGFMGRGRETDEEYRDRLSEIASEAVRAVAGRLSGERDAVAQELAEARLHAANSEAKAEALARDLDALEVAYNVAKHEGRDKQAVLNRFQDQYLERAAEYPEHVRYAIDSILNEQGVKGLKQVQQDREDSAVAKNLEGLARWEARSPDDYLLTNTAEEHLEVIALLREATTQAQYNRFRQGDLTSIDHITTDPVFSRQLLMQAEMYNRGNRYEMSQETERRMEDSRDMLKEHFGLDRGDEYVNERE
ncbi:MobV family relaxase [Marivita sp. S0852]|uniref:MobV family relaxase n=1 Tax=Marivita sp. S0852 TaxID=3373893 RepID=UPI00398252EE